MRLETWKLELKKNRMDTALGLVFAKKDFRNQESCFAKFFCNTVRISLSPKSQMNRENSGICPKRHRLRILLNERYLSMYNTKYRRHRLHVHFEFCYLQKSTPFTFFVITRDDGPPRP
jgi:hypothetical protein